MAQPVDLLVDRRVLLDVEVLARDVRLGLVVVVVGDEVLDRVAREVRPELVAQLGGERLVVRDHERRLLHAPRSSPAIVIVLPVPVAPSSVREALAGGHPVGQRVDRRRLIGGWAIRGIELELGHADGTFERSGTVGRNPRSERRGEEGR